MDRKEKYKQKPGSSKKLRERQRHESNELRRSKRQHVMNAKRVRLASMCEADQDMKVEEVKEIAEQLVQKSGDPHMLLKRLKRAFSQGTALIDAFLSVDNAMAALVGLLTGSESEVQLEAAWCLTNIAAGLENHESTVLTHAGPYLVTYLGSGNAPLQDQCAWAIGNIAGGDAKHRETLRAQGAVQALVNLLQSPNSNVVQSAAFALSNIARDKEKTKELVDMGALPLLACHLVVKEDNMNVLAETAWVLTYVASSGEHEAAMLEAGLLEKLVEVVIQMADTDPNNFKVLTPVLRCLGNLCSRPDDVGLRACQNAALIPALGKLLQGEHRHIKKECLWAISNVTANAEVAKQVMSAKMAEPIVQLLSSTVDMKHEVVYILCNLAFHGAEFCGELQSFGALIGVVPLLKVTDTDTVHLALSFTDMMLRDTDNGRQVFEENDGLVALEALEYHQNDTLRTQTNDILDQYFYQGDHTP